MGPMRWRLQVDTQLPQSNQLVYLMAHPRCAGRRTSGYDNPGVHRMRAISILAVVAALAMMSGQSHAACTATSPAHTLALTELYTSEGCDSCPPADKWMSGLAARGLGPDKVVPLALHVDYWDYIGWKDVFAQPQFTERQRMLSRLSGSTFVYTPQVVVAGRDFRG